MSMLDCEKVNDKENDCCCIAIISKPSRVTEATKVLYKLGINNNCFCVVSNKTGSNRIDELLIGLKVPDGSRYCYQCVIETGLILLVVHGNHNLVETVSRELEKMNGVDISMHLDTCLSYQDQRTRI